MATRSTIGKKVVKTKNSFRLYEGQSILLNSVPTPKEERFLNKEIVIEKIANNKILESFVRETNEKVPFVIDLDLFKIEQYATGGSIDTDQSYYRVFKNSSGKDIPVKIVPNPIMNKYDYYVDGGLRGSFKSYEDAEKEVSRENFELYKDGGNLDLRGGVPKTGSKLLFDLQYGDVYQIIKDQHTATGQYFVFIDLDDKYGDISLRSKDFGDVKKGTRGSEKFVSGVEDGDIRILSREEAGAMLLNYKVNNKLLKDGGNIDSGLMVIGRTQLDNNKIQNIIQENDFYADWDSREGYWFFPEEVENYDALEESLSDLFDEERINARFEGIFAKGGKMSKSKKTSKKTPKPKMVRQYFEDQPYTYKDGGNIEDLEYQDIYNVLKEKIDESMDDLPVDYENSSSYNGEEVEHQSRDGFMAFTDGGYEASWMEYISNFNGAGKSLPTKQLDTEMQRQVGYNYNWAKEKFIEEYPEIVEELGEENIDYNSLYEADYGDEAEQLSEWEMDFEDDSILCEIGAYYYNPDNYRGIDGEHTVRLFGKVNLESPYHRAGNLEDTYDIDITFDSISELETKLSEGLAKIISWFEGDFYNDSDTELGINRMARGGGVTKGEYKIGDKLLLNTKKGKIEALVTKKSDKWTQFDDLTNNKKARWKSTDEVIELMEVLKTQLKKLKATNTTSTTKPTIKTTTSRGKDLAEITLKKLKAVAKKQKVKLGLDVNDVKSLVDAGFTSDEVVSVYAGYTTTVNADTEFGDTSGNLFYQEKSSQKETVKRVVENAKERLFEGGLKYPSFNWSKIISKYDIKLTPKIIERETPYGTTYKYEVYFGNGIAIGHNVGRTEDGEYRSYGEEIGKIDLKKPSAYQKERDYKAGFNGGYWGIVVRKKEDLFSIVDSLLSQKTGYLKDLEIFYNGLGGIDSEDVKNEKFATGGGVDEDDDFEVEEELTYLKLSNSDVVVEIEKRDGKWVEGSVLEGEEPYGWGGKRYMGYLQPDDIINYLNSDYNTNFRIVEQYAKGGGVSKRNYNYIPQDEIDYLMTEYGRKIDGSKLLDGAYAKGKSKAPKVTRTQFEDESFEYANGGKVGRPVRKKFVLYTNPNNSTSRAYIAVGTDVKDVLRDAREYPGSYSILYQATGTNEDFKKAKSMFSNYSFDSSIEIMATGGVVEKYKVVKVFRKSGRREILEKNLTLEEAKRVVSRYPNSNTSMVIFTKM